MFLLKQHFQNFYNSFLVLLASCRPTTSEIYVIKSNNDRLMALPQKCKGLQSE